MAGYPGTIAATWQRAGRAGRRAGRSAAVMVASSAPLDQFIVRNPSYFFDAFARARADRSRQPAHPRRSRQVRGVRAAVHGATSVRQPRPAGGPRRARRAGARASSGRRGQHGGRDWTWTNESYPADAVSLRSVSSDNFVVVDTTGETRVIGETDFTSGRHAASESHLHRRRASCIRWSGSTSTAARRSCGRSTATTTPTRSPTRGSRCSTRSRATDSRRPASARHGEVHVVSRVVGFKKIKFYTNENVGSGELDLPEQQMHTTSYWLTIPAAVMARCRTRADDRRDGIVGLSFAMRQVAQLLLMCDRHDIGISIDTGESEPGRAGQVAPARIFVYDNYPGGIGFSEPLFRMHRELLDAHAAPDCRVRVRERAARVRRAGRQHGPAGQGRGAADPRPAARARRCDGSSRAWRTRLRA